MLSASFLLLASTAHAQLAPPPDQPIRCAHHPALSPDGAQLCFSYQGNLWLAPAKGGDATRLTVSNSYDSAPRFSPDGKTIAFNSDRDGANQIYTLPARGGTPKQWTFHSSGATVSDWSPDGKSLLFTAARDARSTNIYRLDLATGRSKRIVSDENSTTQPRFSPDGRWIVYMRGATDVFRKGYRGSGNYDLWAIPAEGGKARRLTHWQGNDLYPLLSPDGRTLYYVSDRGDNAFTLHTQPFDPENPRPAHPTVLIRNTRDAIWRPALSGNGKLLAYEYDNFLCVAPTRGGVAEPVFLYCRTDSKTDPIERATLTGGATGYDLTADGKKAVFAVRGELFSVSTEKGGEARRLTDTPTRESEAVWSPDGKRLAFLSTRDGSANLYVMEVAAKTVRRLTTTTGADSNPRWSPDGKRIAFLRQGGPEHGLYVVPSEGGTEKRLVPGPWVDDPQWSPDSKWIACVRQDTYLSEDIWILPASGGTPRNITRYPGSNDTPRWFPDGTKLAFRSDRTRNREREKYFETGRYALYTVALEREKDKPSEVEAEEEGQKEEPKKDPKKPVEVSIDFVEIEDRAKQVTAFDEGIGEFAIAPDGRSFVFGTRSLGQFDLWSVSADGGSLNRLTTGLNSFNNLKWASDGSRVYYLSGGTIRFTNRAGGGGTVSFVAKMSIDRLIEQRVAFNEAWKILNEVFYDPSFHGKNWQQIGDKYRPLVDWCTTRQDFHFLMEQMFGELNASHLGISGGGGGRPSLPTAYLGVWYDDKYEGPGVKISAVMPQGPADREESRLKPGEFILAVDGKDVTWTEEFYRSLNDKVGKRIALLVNDKPAKEGARTVRLRSIGAGEWNRLMYEHWVRQRREMVDKLSGGKVAYLHVRGMDDTSRFRFERELFSLTQEKKALVLDVRFNGGGNTHDGLLRILSRNKPYFIMKPRNGMPFLQPERAWTKPTVLLINERSFSDAEIFPNGFRALGLGKLVGVPTNGYVIFTSGQGLIDGSVIRTPYNGCYTLDGKNLENYGVPPDIRVENTPEDFTAGRDPQLERAVEEALKESAGR